MPFIQAKGMRGFMGTLKSCQGWHRGPFFFEDGDHDRCGKCGDLLTKAEVRQAAQGDERQREQVEQSRQRVQS